MENKPPPQTKHGDPQGTVDGQKGQKLNNDTMEIILGMAARVAKRERKGITVLMTLRSNFERRVKQVVYEEMILQTPETLEKAVFAMQSDPGTAAFVKVLCIRKACTPSEILHPRHLDPRYRDIPVHVATILAATAPRVKMLILETLPHPQILYAFRSTVFPNLSTLETFRHLILDPETTLKHQSDMRQHLHRNSGDYENARTPKLTEETLSPEPWPELHRLRIHLDDGDTLFGPDRCNFSHIQSVKQVAIFIGGSTWIFDVMRLCNLVPPPNSDHIAVIHRRQSRHVSPYRPFRWHPNAAIAVLGTPDTTRVVGDGDDDLRQLVTVVPWDGRCGDSFWSHVGTFIDDRERPNTVFNGQNSRIASYPYPDINDFTPLEDME
ncbi:hypothetical protein VNI00_018504 [Paramarasmius palmivorus]|uniref:Uncharacterized protein n=1 Tax=Paramarasmius palmivorus TaxID=297713 RepID=A0AAW0AZA1_9AGAR